MSETNEIHISDDQLLLYADGELGAREAQKVRVHLEACWSCRARHDEVGSAVNTLVRFRNDLLLPAIVPPDSWPGLEPKLSEIDARPKSGSRREHSSRSSSSNVWTYAQLFWRPVAVGNLIVFTVLALLLMLSYRRIPEVSAAEILHRAELSERRAESKVSSPVIYQKLAIQIGRKSFTRTVYLDTAGARHVVHFDKAALRETDVLNPVKMTFETAHFDWQAPLSPAGYMHWSSSLAVSDERVRQFSDVTEIQTTTPDGPIRQATLTFRNSDFHPIGGTWKLQDDSSVEIAELDYRVIPLGEIGPGIFPSTPRPSLRAVIPSRVQLAVSLVDVEIDAMARLDSVNALLNDQVQVVRGVNGTVRVEGVVASSERRQNLIAALGPLAQNPSVRIDLTTVAETEVAQQAANPSTPLKVENIAVPVNPAENPIVRAYLARRLSGAQLDQAVRRFSSIAVDHSIQAQLHALAAKQIVNSLSLGELQGASPKAKEQWHALVVRHMRAVQSELSELSQQLSAAFGSPSAGQPVKQAPDTDLKAAIGQLCELTSSADEALWKALAPPKGSASVNLGTDRQFWDALRRSESLATAIANRFVN